MDPATKAAGVIAAVGSLGLAYHALGLWADAEAQHLRAGALAREHGLRRNENWVLYQRGMLALHGSEYATALDLLEQARTGHIELGDRHEAAKALHGIGLVLLELHQTDSAREPAPRVRPGSGLAVRLSFDDGYRMIPSATTLLSRSWRGYGTSSACR